MSLANQAGMTLVEMLVVLAIIGISTGAAVLSFGVGHGGDGQAEALRLMSRLQLAADETMASDQALALALSPTGYGVVERFDAGQPWRPAALAQLHDVHTLPAGMALSSDVRMSPVPLDADGAGKPFSVTLTKGDQRWVVAFDGVKARLVQIAVAQ
ncbi:prepilin-type N-terminal cleavage/methylation domain-containing protein [Novosphingobium sp.]|uniref:prepilin-type N-terminal cleavage/methylation domain-containing protein n=1 Tax=Novosphingobium sp. TaxID=1874826 RepID=UPI003B52ACBC